MTQAYVIRVKGHLDQSWADWFDGLTILHQDSGDSLLIGPLPDQGALHGVLNRLRDLSIPLISVNTVDVAESRPEEAADE
ncbi:MAG: hypothetical protein KF716_23755 [Anaerolineae bacterium]|nr:hypothetical protein [Anaerolineae bacterium]